MKLIGALIVLIIALASCSRPQKIESVATLETFAIPFDTTRFCKADGIFSLNTKNDNLTGDIEVLVDSAHTLLVALYGTFGISVGKIATVADSMSIDLGKTHIKVSQSDSLGRLVEWGAGLTFRDLKNIFVGRLPEGWNVPARQEPLSMVRTKSTISYLWKTNSGWITSYFDSTGVLQKCVLKMVDTTKDGQVIFAEFKGSTPTEISFACSATESFTINYSSMKKW